MFTKPCGLEISSARGLLPALSLTARCSRRCGSHKRAALEVRRRRQPAPRPSCSHEGALTRRHYHYRPGNPGPFGQQPVRRRRYLDLINFRRLHSNTRNPPGASTRRRPHSAAMLFRYARMAVRTAAHLSTTPLALLRMPRRKGHRLRRQHVPERADVTSSALAGRYNDQQKLHSFTFFMTTLSFFRNICFIASQNMLIMSYFRHETRAVCLVV